MEHVIPLSNFTPRIRTDDQNEREHFVSICAFAMSWLLVLLVRLTRHFAGPAAESSPLHAVLVTLTMVAFMIIAAVLAVSNLGAFCSLMFSKRKSEMEERAPFSPVKFLWACLRYSLFWLVECLGAATIAFLILKGDHDLFRDCLQTIINIPHLFSQLRDKGVLLQGMILPLELFLLPTVLYSMLTLLSYFVISLCRGIRWSTGKMIVAAMLILLLLTSFVAGGAYLIENYKYIARMLLTPLVPLGPYGVLNAILLAGGVLIGVLAAIAGTLFWATQVRLKKLYNLN